MIERTLKKLYELFRLFYHKNCFYGIEIVLGGINANKGKSVFPGIQVIFMLARIRESGRSSDLSLYWLYGLMKVYSIGLGKTSPGAEYIFRSRELQKNIIFFPSQWVSCFVDAVKMDSKERRFTETASHTPLLKKWTTQTLRAALWPQKPRDVLFQPFFIGNYFSFFILPYGFLKLLLIIPRFKIMLKQYIGCISMRSESSFPIWIHKEHSAAMLNGIQEEINHSEYTLPSNVNVFAIFRVSRTDKLNHLLSSLVLRSNNIFIQSSVLPQPLHIRRIWKCILKSFQVRLLVEIHCSWRRTDYSCAWSTKLCYSNDVSY